MDVAEDSQVDVAITRSAQEIPWRIAIGSAGANAACHARAVVYESGRIEPLGSRASRADAASVRIEDDRRAGNDIRAVGIGTVIILVRAG